MLFLIETTIVMTPAMTNVNKNKSYAQFANPLVGLVGSLLEFPGNQRDLKYYMILSVFRTITSLSKHIRRWCVCQKLLGNLIIPNAEFHLEDQARTYFTIHIMMWVYLY